MKLLIPMAVLVVFGSTFVALRLATADPAPTTMPTTQPMIFNKVCPITGEAVDPKVPTVQYNGLTIGFCCEDCVGKFKANPDKYAANLK